MKKQKQLIIFFNFQKTSTPDFSLLNETVKYSIGSLL